MTRLAAGARILNLSGELLIVKPSYKSYWHIPGGVVEKSESPLEACVREVREEIGWSIEPECLLAVNHEREKTDYQSKVIFVFDGGIISDQDISQLVLQKNEISEIKFIPLKSCSDFLDPVMSRIITSIDDHPKYLDSENIF